MQCSDNLQVIEIFYHSSLQYYVFNYIKIYKIEMSMTIGVGLWSEMSMTIGVGLWSEMSMTIGVGLWSEMSMTIGVGLWSEIALKE